MIRYAVRTVVLTMAIACAPPVEADYEAGQRAWNAGRPNEALEQWQAAAQSGDPRAMLALGRLFARSLGAFRDYVEACKWLNLAASHGEAEAVKERDALTSRMTPEQVAMAQERASAWRPGRSSVGDAPKVPRAAVPIRAPAADLLPSPEIREAQTLLAELGYEPGSADGVWGERTGRAYRAFLRDAGLPATEELTLPALRAMRVIAARRSHSAGPGRGTAAAAPEAPRKPSGAERGRSEHKWPVGRRFRDCDACPELVVVPSGTFEMGSPSHETGREEDEGPVHRVKIGKRFAVGMYEVTFDEWDACAGGGGCGGYRSDDEGLGRGRLPVINVDWDDAQSYVAWLSRQTGKEYRLPSESEWEYVARAGTTTPFHTGVTISTDQANYDGGYVYGSGRSGRFRQRTTPAGSFPANGFGLHDVHGNVWEWVEDCWNESYEGVPDDGSAWLTGKCSHRVLRGGSWGDPPWIVRSAFRYRETTALRINLVGFRVARSLD